MSQRRLQYPDWIYKPLPYIYMLMGVLIALPAGLGAVILAVNSRLPASLGSGESRVEDHGGAPVTMALD